MAVRAPRSSSILNLAQQKWRSSGLTDEHARKLGFRPLSAAEVQAALKTDRTQAGGMLIPYLGLDGKQTSFFRIRYLEPMPGWAGLVEKPQRYVQPAKTLNEVYLPTILPVKWSDVAEDPEVPVYFTEGEFKAACGCAHGLATVGLGGVDMWRATKRGIDLLPTLKEFEWKNRQVVIVYDSDAATNPNVVRAERQLAHELVAKGAFPSVASLPPTKDGSKQGLDDFLVAHGQDKLLKLIAEAPFYPEADALWGLNEEVLYIRNPGIVVEKRTGMTMDPSRFTSHAYANRHYKETASTKNGGFTTKTKPLAPRWIDWEARHEVEKIIYAPGKPRLVDGAWNTWAGWGCDPVKGDVSLWKRLLDHLFGKDDASRKWFEQWCAYPIQHPGVKMFSASLVWGTIHGTGKSLVAYLLRSIYGENGIEITSQDLRGSFNSWAVGKQFVVGDEITAGESRLDKEKLKSLITRPKIRVNEKFMPEYSIDDCINYLFNSNQPDALFIEDEDRRTFVHQVLSGKASQEFYDDCDRWLNGNVPNSGKGPGPAMLFHYLLGVDLSGFNPRAQALTTAGKREMIVNGKSQLGSWVSQLKHDPVNALRPLHGTIGEKGLKDCDLFTPAALLRAFDPERAMNGKITESVMGRELNKAGFMQANAATPIRTKLGIIRLYPVRNLERWRDASPKDLATHYESHFANAKC